MKTIKTALFSLLTTATACGLAASATASDLVKPEPINQMGKFMPGFGNENLVKVRYTVKADGTTDDIEIDALMSSNQFLTNQITNTVKNWTFKPGTADGSPVDFHNQEWLFVMRVNPNAPQMGPGGFGRGGFGGGRGGPGNAAKTDEDAAEGEETAAAPGPGGMGGGRGPGMGGGMGPGMNAAAMAPLPLSLSPDFQESFDEVTALVSAQDYDKAYKEVRRLIRNKLHTVFDYSLANELQASVQTAMNEPFAALEASKRATMQGVSAQGEKIYFMDDTFLESALRKRFLLAATVRQYQLAWDSYQELTERFDIPADDILHERAAKVKAVLDSPEPMAQLAKITDKQWTHRPARRIFTVTDVNGRLKQINARCERSNLELKYQEGVDWTLPESIGDCELDFIGSDDTQFTLYEFSE